MFTLSSKAKKALIELAKGVLTALIAFLTALCVESCANTRALVTNKASGTETTIKITTANPSSVDVNANADVKFGKDNE